MTATIYPVNPTKRASFCVVSGSQRGQIWEGVSASGVASRRTKVRTLDPDFRTSQQVPFCVGEVSKERTITREKTHSGRGVINFLLGGVFGLGLVLGLIFVDSADDPIPTYGLPGDMTVGSTSN